MISVLADARRGHRGLYAFAVAMAVLTPVLAALSVVDHRELLGAPLWFKPLKFAISLTLYSATLAWMLGQLRERTLQWAGWVITAAAAVEMAIIVGQAAVGHRSHYNVDTPLSAALWSTMGVTIVILWFATLAVALRFLREPGRDPAASSAVRWGLAITLVGLAEGFLMAGSGAHTVGLADGGPGLPFLGWSTVGGDLRIGHFIGMHALQAIPLVAAALAATHRLDEAVRLRLVRVAAVAWTGVVLLVTWQALRAQPLLAPDATTLAAAAVLVSGTVGATGAVLVTGRRRAVPTPA